MLRRAKPGVDPQRGSRGNPASVHEDGFGRAKSPEKGVDGRIVVLEKGVSGLVITLNGFLAKFIASIHAAFSELVGPGRLTGQRNF